MTMFLQPRKFPLQEINLLTTFASQASVAIENAKLVTEMKKMYFKTVHSFASALHARDVYTRDHSEEAARWAVKIGAAIGLNEEQLELLQHGALLHDIGKIGIPNPYCFNGLNLDHPSNAFIPVLVAMVAVAMSPPIINPLRRPVPALIYTSS